MEGRCVKKYLPLLLAIECKYYRRRDDGRDSVFFCWPVSMNYFDVGVNTVLSVTRISLYIKGYMLTLRLLSVEAIYNNASGCVFGAHDDVHVCTSRSMYR
jgi:hypothetical protein